MARRTWHWEIKEELGYHLRLWRVDKFPRSHHQKMNRIQNEGSYMSSESWGLCELWWLKSLHYRGCFQAEALGLCGLGKAEGIESLAFDFSVAYRVLVGSPYGLLLLLALPFNSRSHAFYVYTISACTVCWINLYKTIVWHKRKE